MSRVAAKRVKIAYIGGGSRGWARMLMRDLALCPHMEGELALYDIDLRAAKFNQRWAKYIFGHKDAKSVFDVKVYSSLNKALKGADFVVASILPGPVRMMVSDLEIPKEYGILQTVGDSTGPGGIVRALRTIPIYKGFAHRIMDVCPKAWVINYSNPMTLDTSTLYAAEPEIKAFGCCHEVFGTQARLAKLVKKYWGAKNVARQEIKIDIAGVNHFTFITQASYKGRDVFPLIRRHIGQKGLFRDHTTEASKRRRKGAWFSSDGLIAYDFFRRFGAMGAAGDRHLAEFVPWYLTSERELHRWGVIATPSSYRIDYYRKPRPRPKKEDELWGSGEEGAQQMAALLGKGQLDTNVNIPNRGQNPLLPMGAIIETNAQFRRNSVKPVVAKPLPAMLNNLVTRVVNVQQMVLKAGMERDKDLAFQAVLNDPLVNIQTDKAWEMFNRMLKATKALLPGWKI